MYRYGTVAETSEIHISTADTEIMDILSYIDTNFMNNPSVSELAKKAGLSESHFMTQQAVHTKLTSTDTKTKSHRQCSPNRQKVSRKYPTSLAFAIPIISALFLNK